MTRLGEIPAAQRQALLQGAGLALRVGPYVYSIRSNVPVVHEGIGALYGDFPLAAPGDYVDFSVALETTGPWQRLRGEAKFFSDGVSPFERIPRGQAYAFLEWGMNWCVALHTNEYLKLHAAVVSRGGPAVVMPGVPGAGKSTLCAALGLKGWRVLSDEHAMVPPGSCSAVPVYRPISLKNESIEVVRKFAPGAIFGPQSEATHKGVVRHLKADLSPRSHDPEPLPVGALVFPRYAPGAPQRLAPRPKTESFILAAYHSFNYSLLCETGFDTMRTLVDTAHCYDLSYHDLDWAVDAMEQLADGGMPA